MKWKIEEVPHLKGYTVEWAEPGNYYLSRRHSIFHSSALTPPFTRLVSVDASLLRRTVSLSRLGQRLLRFMVTNVMPLPNGDIFITFDKSVGVVRDGRYRALAGLRRPCRVLRSACAVDRQGNVVFGEYLANEERGPMHVYKFSSGGEGLEVIHTFPSGSIKHIHGVYFDEFTGAIYCLTGDDEKECRILRTNDEFQTIETVGEGDETWRAVSLLFTRDAIFYGTDAEFRANQIYRLGRKTSERRILGDVSGTVFYSKQIGDVPFFATTAENAPSQKENVAAIWVVDGNQNVEQVAKFEKDFWHPTLFMFGTIHFPYRNNLPNELYFHIVGAKGYNRTFRLSRQQAD